MTETAHFTTGDGCRIAYRFDGAVDTPVLVLSNSLALSLHMWDGLIGQLSRRFRVLRYVPAPDRETPLWILSGQSRG